MEAATETQPPRRRSSPREGPPPREVVFNALVEVGTNDDMLAQNAAPCWAVARDGLRHAAGDAVRAVACVPCEAQAAWGSGERWPCLVTAAFPPALVPLLATAAHRYNVAHGGKAGIWPQYALQAWLCPCFLVCQLRRARRREALARKNDALSVATPPPGDSDSMTRTTHEFAVSGAHQA